MTEITPLSTDDIDQQSLDWLVTQFKQSENLKEFLGALNHTHADFETILDNIRTNLNVDVATGFMLDVLGGLVGEDRQSRSDDIYRLFIKARIRANISGSTADELIQIVQVLKSATEAWNALSAEDQALVNFEVFYAIYAPAYYAITVSGLDLTASDVAAIAEILDLADPAGVGSDISYGEGPLFAFDGGVGTGFGDGIFAEVV